jgi:hypothetical protein
MRDLEMAATATVAGYQTEAYALSLAEFGTPLRLPRSGGWLLERTIGDLPYRDAMGCYPFFSCSDWSGLKADLDDLATSLVSVSMVTDPFGRYTEAGLRQCFNEKVIPFKSHFIADLDQSAQKSVSKHHRYYAQRALADIKIERCSDPLRHLDEWMSLYDSLITKHRLSGIKAFSPRAFTAQLKIPGIIMLRASHGDQTIAAHLWYKQGDVIHSHLAASSAVGYEVMASYGIYWSALQMFAGEARWLNFGAAAGLGSRDTTGLADFKKGWATGTRTAYFCGHVYDRLRYSEALNASRFANSDYFPAYRSGEMSS